MTGWMRVDCEVAGELQHCIGWRKRGVNWLFAIRVEEGRRGASRDQSMNAFANIAEQLQIRPAARRPTEVFSGRAKPHDDSQLRWPVNGRLGN
jgi:hypothetical protein